ncbi:MAG: ABC transporter substrate-binding protein [Eubacteriales bacterium]
MKRKMMAVLTMVAITGTLFVGCGSSETSSSEETVSTEETVATEEVSEASYTIGISQFAEHSSLDNCREGFLAGLAAAGIVEGENLTVEYSNAATDSGTAGLIADSFVSDNVDLICGIATLSAQTAYNAAMDKEIPVIFTAVTDPIAAELANEDGTPVGEITGVSDELAVEKQLQMIREMLPEAKTLGIMYTTSEVNSVSAIAEYEALVADYGFELVTVGITSTADVSLATEELISKVDCITNLTDNTVVNSLATILDKTNEKNIPVFGSEIEQVKIGCLAAQGIDYVKLGEQAGSMAAQVLLGEALASEINFEIVTEVELYYNSAVAEQLGITIDEEIIADAAQVFDTIVVE